jgi:phage gp45-like
MMTQLRELGAKLRNLFAVSEFQKRYTDGDQKGRIQVKTHNGRVLEKKEAFPYGFYARAKGGRAFVFCQGGNMDGFEIFPVLPGDDVTPPELEEGDAALYTGGGGWIVLREKGEVELYGKDSGGLVKVDELKKQLDVMTARIDGIMDALKNASPVPQDGGTAYKTAIMAALAALKNKEDFGNIASEKVFHGTGTT